MDHLVKIFPVADQYLIWDADKVFELRIKYRICGTLVGSLPRKPWQSGVCSLPLSLHPVEAAFLVKRGYGCLVCCKGCLNTAKNVTSSDVQEFCSKRTQLEIDQVKSFVMVKQNKKERFYGMKRNKLKCRLRNTDFDETASDLSHYVGASSVHLQQFVMSDAGAASTTGQGEQLEEMAPSTCLDLTCPTASASVIEKAEVLGSQADISDYMWNSVRVLIPLQGLNYALSCNSSCCQELKLSEHGQTCLAVYEDLWDRGFYVTGASKFGSDFLVYSGDPFRFHAGCIVVVADASTMLNGKDLVAYGRLGASVCKSVVIANVNVDSTVEYLTISWTHLAACW